MPPTERKAYPRLKWKEKGLGGVLAVMCCIAIATYFAASTVPFSFHRSDALFTPALLLTTGLLIPVVLRARSGMHSMMRVENVLLVGLVYWLLMDLLQSAFPLANVSRASVQYAFVLIGAFSIMLWVGASGPGIALPASVRASARKIPTKYLGMLIFVSFTLGMSKFAIASGFDISLMIEGLGASRFSAPWARGEFGGANAFLDHMQYFGYMMPSLCVILASRTGWFSGRVLFGLLLAAIMIAFLSQTGGRRVIGVVVGAALVTWIVSSPNRVNARVMIGASLTIVSLLYFLQEMLRYRNVGFVRIVAGDRPELSVSHLHVDDNFLRLTQLIEFYPQRFDYLYFQPVFHALTLPIPRIFWPGKPTGSGIDLPGLLGKEGVSLSVSVVGELYVSYGILAVMIGGFVLGRLSGMWNRLFQLRGTSGSNALLFGVGLMAMFVGLRSVQALVQMSYIILAWILIVSFLPRTRSFPGVISGPEGVK